MPHELVPEILDATKQIRSAINDLMKRVPVKERSETHKSIKADAQRQKDWLASLPVRKGAPKEAIALEAEVRTVQLRGLEVDIGPANSLLSCLGLEPLPLSDPDSFSPPPVEAPKADTRLAESKAAWEKFHKTAGRSDDRIVWLKWAITAASLAHEPGYSEPLWQNVVEPPPDVVAIAYAQQAFTDRTKVLAELSKLLDGGGDDGMIRAERKRQDELLRMLQETADEIEAKGVNAYAT